MRRSKWIWRNAYSLILLLWYKLFSQNGAHKCLEAPALVTEWELRPYLCVSFDFCIVIQQRPVTINTELEKNLDLFFYYRSKEVSGRRNDLLSCSWNVGFWTALSCHLCKWCFISIVTSQFWFLTYASSNITVKHWIASSLQDQPLSDIYNMMYNLLI